MSTSRVAVIMVTADYHSPYICEAIASVQAQTMGQWELHIQDDGPLGLAGEAAASLIKDDTRISYELQENLGIWKLAHTYNRALEHTSAPFVAILEGDDFWPAEKLAIQISPLEKSNAVLSSGFVDTVSSDGKTVLERFPAKDLLARPDALENTPVGLTAVVMGYNWQFLSPASLVIRRQALQEIGGFQYRDYYPSVDFPTVLELAAKGPFQFHHQVLGYWRRHGTSVTSSQIPIEVYMSGLFRCWREVVEKYHICVATEEKRQVESKWNQRLAEYRWLLGRKALSEGQYAQARSLFRQSYPYLSKPASALTRCGVGVARLPLTAQLLEQSYKMMGKPTLTDENIQRSLATAECVIPAYQSWIKWLRSYSPSAGW